MFANEVKPGDWVVIVREAPPERPMGELMSWAGPQATETSHLRDGLPMEVRAIARPWLFCEAIGERQGVAVDLRRVVVRTVDEAYQRAWQENYRRFFPAKVVGHDVRGCALTEDGPVEPEAKSEHRHPCPVCRGEMRDTLVIGEGAWVLRCLECGFSGRSADG